MPGPIWRSVLDADVHANDPQPRQLGCEILGHGVGPALAHERGWPHALLVEGFAHGRDARQAVHGPWQQEVLVVEAEDGAAAHRLRQHGHLQPHVLGRAQAQAAPRHVVLAAIAQHRRDRTKAALGPAAAAAADGNEGNAKLARVLAVALGQGQTVQIGGQRARRRSIGTSLAVGQGQTGDAAERPATGDGIEKLGDGALAFVKHHAVHTVPAGQDRRLGHGGELTAGSDVAAKTGPAQIAG